MTLPQITITTPAKVNLYLGVGTGRDSRGYHRVDTVMSAVDLTDTLTLCPSHAFEVVCGPEVSCPPEDNTVTRAALSLAEATGNPCDVRVVVDKRIPAQAGLGGGSSDAAAVLVGLARLWGVDPAGPEVLSCAKAVGADVAFFLHGRPALMGGDGSDLVRTFDPVSLPVVLVRPAGPGISTAAAYAEFDREPTCAADPAPLVRALADGDAAAVPSACANNLDPVARRLMAAEQLVWDRVRTRPGVLACQVSGSGSCVFGLCASMAAAEDAAFDAARQGWWSCASALAGGGPTVVSDTWSAARR